MAKETTYIFDVTLTLRLKGVEISSEDRDAAEQAAIDECQAHGEVTDCYVTLTDD